MTFLTKFGIEMPVKSNLGILSKFSFNQSLKQPFKSNFVNFQLVLRLSVLPIFVKAGYTFLPFFDGFFARDVINRMKISIFFQKPSWIIKIYHW